MRRRVGRRLLVGAVLLVGLLQVSSAEAGAWQRYRAKKWLALSWVLSPFFGPIAPIVVKKRGVIVQILDRFVEARVKRNEEKGVLFRAKRKKKV